jgi:hypothetical protein
MHYKKGTVRYVSDPQKPIAAAVPEDELQTALTHTGANAPSVDRLGRVARDMQQIEWKMLRKAAGAGGDPSSSSRSDSGGSGL